MHVLEIEGNSDVLQKVFAEYTKIAELLLSRGEISRGVLSRR
jgi:hypothetical protein